MTMKSKNWQCFIPEHEFLHFSLHDTQQKATSYSPAHPPPFTLYAHMSACSAASQMTTEVSISRILC